MIDPNEFGQNGHQDADIETVDVKDGAKMELGDLFKQFLDSIPMNFVTMFDPDSDRLKMLTDIPQHALASTIMLDVINQAKDPTIDLMDYMVKIIDMRMIAKDRMGRNEAKEILIAEKMADAEEEGEEVRAPGFE